MRSMNPRAGAKILSVAYPQSVGSLSLWCVGKAENPMDRLHLYYNKISA